MDRIRAYKKIYGLEYKVISKLKVWVGSDICAVFSEQDCGFNRSVYVIDGYVKYDGDALEDCLYYKYSAKDNTIYFNIPSIINNSLVVGIGNLIPIAVNDIIKRNDIEDITIDLTNADLGNILQAEMMFMQIGVMSNVTIHMPKGDNILKPVSVTKMFSGTKVANIDDVIQSIEFSNTLYADRMFEYSPLDKVDLSRVDFGNLCTTQGMFNGSYVMNVKLPMDGMKNVVETNSMFNWCRRLKEVDIRGFKYNNVYAARSMFGYSGSLKSIKADWEHMFKEASVDSMFAEDYELEDIDVEGFIRGAALNPDKFMASNEIIFTKVFKSCEKIKWARMHTPMNLDSRFDYDAVCCIIGSMRCNLLDISDIRVGGNPIKILAYRRMMFDSVVEYMPNILIVDNEQYLAEKDDYIDLEKSGLCIVKIKRDDCVKNIVKKIGLFQGGVTKYVVVLGGRK